jgi:hypothetical protein
MTDKNLGQTKFHRKIFKAKAFSSLYYTLNQVHTIPTSGTEFGRIVKKKVSFHKTFTFATKKRHPNTHLSR